MSLLNRFDERKCGCIVRGDGQHLRFCGQHGTIHRGILLSKYPGVDKTGAKKVRRGQGHTRKTHGPDAQHARQLARNLADYEALDKGRHGRTRPKGA